MDLDVITDHCVEDKAVGRERTVMIKIQMMNMWRGVLILVMMMMITMYEDNIDNDGDGVFDHTQDKEGADWNAENKRHVGIETDDDDDCGGEGDDDNDDGSDFVDVDAD